MQTFEILSLICNALQFSPPRIRPVGLKEAADCFSVTRLEEALGPLDQNDKFHRKAAAYLNQLIQEGDFDRISEFLEKVKRT